MSTEPSADIRPRPLLAVAALVGLEGAAVSALGVYLVVDGLIDRPRNVINAEVTGALALVTGIALLVVARGLLRGRRWSRSPAILTQLLGLPVSWGLLQAGQWAFGVLTGVVAIAVLVLLLSPATTYAFRD